jgi:hypothetical protein
VTKTVEGIYQILADVICQSIDDEWKKAWITAKILDDFDEAEYDYQLPDGTEKWFDPGFENNDTVTNSLKELRELMRQEGKDPWSKIVFTLTAEGKFNIDLSYGDQS